MLSRLRRRYEFGMGMNALFIEIKAGILYVINVKARCYSMARSAPRTANVSTHVDPETVRFLTEK